MQSPQEQKAIVQRMIDAGESEENIATVIQHFQKTANTPPAREPFNSPRLIQAADTAGRAISDVAIGAVKGAGSTVLGLSQLINKGTAAIGLSTPVKPEVWDRARQDFTTPTNAMQTIGKTGEQVGEFFIPVAGEAKLAAKFANAPRLVRAVTRAVRPAAQTAIQTGGDVTSSAVSGALGAVLPGSSGLKNASNRLQQSAEKTIVQALGPTKEAMKETAKKIAPEILERGISGSRPAMLAQAKDATKRVGAAIGQTIKEAAEGGATLPASPLRSALREASEKLLVLDESGHAIPIEGAQPVIRQLERLDKFIGQLGSDIPVDKAAHLKTAWDKIVDRAGLYGQKVGAAPTDQAKAWAFREAASALRNTFNSESPTLQAMNGEYAFWTGLKKVLTATEKRTQAQGPGLGNVIMTTGGGVAGFSSGTTIEDRIKNAALGAAGAKFIGLLRSPAFKTVVSAPMKARLADALASDSALSINAAVRSILASLPAQIRNSLQEPQ